MSMITSPFPLMYVHMVPAPPAGTDVRAPRSRNWAAVAASSFETSEQAIGTAEADGWEPVGEEADGADAGAETVGAADCWLPTPGPEPGLRTNAPPTATRAASAAAPASSRRVWVMGRNLHGSQSRS